MYIWSTQLDDYAGWKIFECKVPTIANPKVGQTCESVIRFCACQHSVSMNTNTLDGIKRMVDDKNYLTEKRLAEVGF